MEKIQEMPQPGPTAPTAPLPTAPPSYEEAVAQSGYVANLPNSPPYPAAGSQMPMPTPCMFISFNLLLLYIPLIM